MTITSVSDRWRNAIFASRRTESEKRSGSSLREKDSKGTIFERAVEVITSSTTRWVDMMMAEEHGVPPVTRSPVMAGLATFAAFLLCGLVPLLPFVAGRCF